jgi:starch phosphorylase
MTPAPRKPLVAYFSMEVGLEPAVPTHSGGLGVLAGDTLRAAADLGVPMVGVSLLHRKGYFRQRLGPGGEQREEPAEWPVEKYLREMPARTAVTIEGRTVHLRCWGYEVVGVGGSRVPVYLLDADLPENAEADRALTHFLYGGDAYYRLCQEVVLGVGGPRMLRALGYEPPERYHMNEGHASLLTLELLDEEVRKAGRRSATREDIDAVRARCVFTTHTPVPAGHDQFPLDLVGRVFAHRQDLLDLKDGPIAEVVGRVLHLPGHFADVGAVLASGGALNTTYLALNLSRYVNGVAMRHGEVSRDMFPGYPINSITNGVHAATWASEPFQRLYDRHFPEWRRDNLYLRYAVGLAPGEVQGAHAEAKRALLAEVERRGGRLDPAALTLGFARRATGYKRAGLLFTDRDRLRRIARAAGPVQAVFAGKAHPRDGGGKEAIRRVFEAAADLKDAVRVVYLEEYDMALAKLACAGADVWLNTPQKPQEASGTSGMKAALNGVPSLSVLDGWWLEGCLEGVTGWAVGEDGQTPSDPAREAASLYDKLEFVILPLFYGRPLAFAEVMRSAIALNGSYYNAQRMVWQYVQNAYLPAAAGVGEPGRAGAPGSPAA